MQNAPRLQDIEIMEDAIGVDFPFRVSDFDSGFTFNLKQLAKALCISVSSASKLVRDGVFDGAYKEHGVWVIPSKPVAQYIAQREIENTHRKQRQAQARAKHARYMAHKARRELEHRAVSLEVVDFEDIEPESLAAVMD